MNQVKQLIDTLADALETNEVDDNKIAEILRRYKDDKDSVKSIILAIGYLRDKNTGK